MIINIKMLIIYQLIKLIRKQNWERIIKTKLKHEIRIRN